MKTTPSLLESESGSLVVDFMFAFTLIFSFVTIFISIAITLTTVEMVQYLTFAGARAYFASHHTVDSQREQGHAKYQELLGTAAYGFVKNGNWFTVEAPFVGDVTSGVEELNAYAQPPDKPNRFHGVVTYFTANILSASSPFFGSTDPERDGTGSTFGTNIGSYLGREPTMEECQKFMTDRFKAILSMNANGGAAYSTGVDENSYTVIMDNGC